MSELLAVEFNNCESSKETKFDVKYANIVKLTT